jgi:hypothetical protein
MGISLTVDRFEGKSKEIAVLIDDQDRVINVPRDLLPKGVKAGEILNVTFARDLKATKAVQEKTDALRAELKKRDPGGDIAI